MRNLLRLTCAALLLAAPIGASAEERGEVKNDRPPVLRLEVEREVLKVVPTAPRSLPVEVEPAGLRRARVGVGVSTAFLGAGAIMLGAGLSSCNEPPSPPSIVGNLGACGAAYAGAALAGAGLIGLVVSAALLGTRSKEHRNAQSAMSARERRVRWDLRSGKVVF